MVLPNLFASTRVRSIGRDLLWDLLSPHRCQLATRRKKGEKAHGSETGSAGSSSGASIHCPRWPSSSLLQSQPSPTAVGGGSRAELKDHAMDYPHQVFPEMLIRMPTVNNRAPRSQTREGSTIQPAGAEGPADRSFAVKPVRRKGQG